MHLITQKQIFVNHDRQIKFQIKPATIVGSIKKWSKGPNAPGALDYHVSICIVIFLRISLFLTIDSFYHQISQPRPLHDTLSPQKDSSSPREKTLGGPHRSLRLIWPEKASKTFGQLKPQAINSLSLVVKDLNHHHQWSTIIVIYQNLPLFSRVLVGKFHHL